MDCNGIRKHCQPYLDRELEEPAAQSFTAHLQGCLPCAAFVDGERRFHGVLKKLYSGESLAAPASLKGRISNVLNTGRIVPMTAHMPPARLRGPVAVAASFMLGMSGLLGVQSFCLQKQCPLVMAAQHEHDNIVAGTRVVLEKSTDAAALSRCLSAHLGRDIGVPNLAHCELEPIACGKVSISGLPDGIFVEYARCTCGDEAVTLMAIDTKATPGGELVRSKFKAAIFNGHKVLSWHAAKDGMLYIVVTKLSMDEALEVAEIAGK